MSTHCVLSFTIDCNNPVLPAPDFFTGICSAIHMLFSLKMLTKNQNTRAHVCEIMVPFLYLQNAYEGLFSLICCKCQDMLVC